MARRTLPPHFELRTRPDELEDREIAVPTDCSGSATGQWAIQTAGRHLEAVTSSLAQTTVQEVFRAQCDLFDSSLCADPSRVLVWFSGKDLLAALEGWWTELGFENAGACRAHVRDWVRAHPGEALALLPEWQALAEAIRQI